MTEDKNKEELEKEEVKQEPIEEVREAAKNEKIVEELESKEEELESKAEEFEKKEAKKEAIDEARELAKNEKIIEELEAKEEELESKAEEFEKEEEMKEKFANNLEPEEDTNYENQSPVRNEDTQNKAETRISEKPIKLGTKNWLSIIALILIFSFIGGFGGTYLGNQIFVKGLQAIPNDPPISIGTNDSLNTVSAVVQKNIRSVVGITTVATISNSFTQEDVSGVGSGLIVSKDGYILTNAHVVADGSAKEIKVLFDDGETVLGNIIWVDPLIDLAVIKVEKTGLPAAELGDSDKLVVGEIAIAIGNPLGLEFDRSVTSGIISGLNRTVQLDQSTIIDYLIQTDASINPGNSGGPLLNAKGQVIAINTAKVKTAEGLGFAIPINQVKAVVDEIIKTGKFQSVYLGISGIRVQEYEQRLGVKLDPAKGVITIEVEKGSPAEKAGMITGDVIQGIDGKEVNNMGQLKRNLYQFKKGDSVSLKIIRSGVEMNIDVEFTNVR